MIRKALACSVLYFLLTVVAVAKDISGFCAVTNGPYLIKVTWPGNSGGVFLPGAYGFYTVTGVPNNVIAVARCVDQNGTIVSNVVACATWSENSFPTLYNK